MSSPGIHSSLAHLKDDRVKPEKGPGESSTDSEAGSKTDPGVVSTITDSVPATADTANGGSISSVSSIIHDLRKTRKAQQQQQQQHVEAGESTEDSLDSHTMMQQNLFSTYELVNKLADSGFTRGQATAIMKLVKLRVNLGMEKVQLEMLTRSDLENDAYLFKAALQELRTETQVIRKNDQALLESHAAAISRDIESLAQRTNDEIANLRSDIEIEMNNRKHDSSHAMKHLDMKLHALASRYQVLVGEMKTDIEAIRLESIRSGLVAVVVTALVVVGFVWVPTLWNKEGSEDDSDSTDSNAKKAGTAKHRSTQAPFGGAADPVHHKDSSHGFSDHRHHISGVPDPAGISARPAERPAVADGNSAYRDHRHLLIQYDPTISSAESQFGSVAAPPKADDSSKAEDKEEDKYDDWFDSFFYPPQDIAERRQTNKATLMEGDSKLDSAFWNTPDSGKSDGDAQEPAEQNAADRGDTDDKEATSQLPLHFTYPTGDETSSDVSAK
ncbi:hypothetical protein EC988_002435 [Linderina pennispora]|nr:hypothetical protein EC988_002435 [Linderina pennispora]